MSEQKEQFFNTLVLYEQIPKARVKNVRALSSDIVDNIQKMTIDKYIKLNTIDGYKIEYTHPDLKDYGRIKQKPYTGLGTFNQKVRGYLANGIYLDIDIINCHPTILYHEFKRLSIDYTIIKEYVTNREEFLKRELINKEDFLIMINKENYETNNKTLKQLHNQIYNIFLPAVLKENEEIKIKKNIDNANGKFVANYLQSIEFKILTELFKFGKKNNIFIDVLMHDGFYVRITEEINEEIIKSKFLEQFSNTIMTIFNMDIKFKIKEHDLSLLKFVNEVSNKGLKMYPETKAEFEKNHCKIINKSFFVKQLEDDFAFMTRTNLLMSYEHIMCGVMKDDGEITSTPFIKKWLQDPEIRAFDDIGCYPDRHRCPDNIFNTWLGFAMERVTNYEPNEEGLKCILGHIKVLCNNNDDVYEYFIRWVGQMFKYPEKKTICPTLISNQGAGKSTLFELLRKMIGDKLVFECTNPSRDVWGHFNSRMASTFLVNLNELTKKDTLEAEGKIKGLITDRDLTINCKGIGEYKIESYHRFIITTNNFEPINTSKDDRRNFIIRSSDEKIGDKDYFEKLYEFMDDINVVKTCFEYFKNLSDLEIFNKLKMPITEHQKDLIALSASPIELWLEHLVNNPPKDKVQNNILELESQEVYRDFLDYCNTNGIECKINSLSLATRLGMLKFGGIGTKKPNKTRIRTFDLNVLRTHFNN